LLVALSSVLAPGQARGGGTGVEAEVAALTAGLPGCEAGRAHCIGVRIHVAAGPEASGEDGERLIATAEWLAAQLAAANRQFAAIDVGFQVVSGEPLPASAGHVATAADRDAVAEGRLGGTVIHVFVTGRLDDIDEPGSVIRGVTWHRRGSDRKYVILSTAAPDRVLAHELGHAFGLPHSRYAISIMNKAPRAVPPPEDRRFADQELAAMRPVVKRLLHDGVLAEIAQAAPARR
jgi:hypothetical protein